MTFEFARTGVPARLQGALTASARVYFQSPLGSLGQIGIESPGDAILHDVDWPGDRKCRYRDATGHRLEIDQPEGVGEAREHEQIGGGYVRRQILAEAKPRIDGLGVQRLQSLALGPIA